MNRTLDELLERRDALNEQLGDMETQHKAETAHYGDSWPGAQVEIEAMRQHVAALDREIEAADVSRRGSSPCQSESGTPQGALRKAK